MYVLMIHPVQSILFSVLQYKHFQLLHLKYIVENVFFGNVFFHVRLFCSNNQCHKWFSCPILHRTDQYLVVVPFPPEVRFYPVNNLQTSLNNKAIQIAFAHFSEEYKKNIRSITIRTSPLSCRQLKGNVQCFLNCESSTLHWEEFVPIYSHCSDWTLDHGYLVAMSQLP